MAGLDALNARDGGAGGADAVVIFQDETKAGEYHRVADELRATGLRIDVFPGNRKLGQQYSFADKKRIPAAVLVGDDWSGAGTLAIRDLGRRKNSEGLSLGAAADLIRSIADRSESVPEDG
jgi:histidyl-tRNA synthetase